MRYIVLGLLLTGLSGTSLQAQNDPSPTAMDQSSPEISSTTATVQKMRHICKQLNLDEQQQQHVEGLLEILAQEERMSGDELKQRLEEIRSTMQDRDAALKAGKKEEADKLQKQLQQLTPRASAERNFVAGLLPALNDEQKTRFQMLLKRAQGTADFSLKPIEVVRIARKQKLTMEQEQQLELLMAKFRKDIVSASKPQARELLIKFVGQVRLILDAQQQKSFDLETRMLDPELPTPAALPNKDN